MWLVNETFLIKTIQELAAYLEDNKLHTHKVRFVEILEDSEADSEANVKIGVAKAFRFPVPLGRSDELE